jgi:hypothetical protein
MQGFEGEPDWDWSDAGNSGRNRILLNARPNRGPMKSSQNRKVIKHKATVASKHAYIHTHTLLELFDGPYACHPKWGEERYKSPSYLAQAFSSPTSEAESEVTILSPSRSHLGSSMTVSGLHNATSSASLAPFVCSTSVAYALASLHH